jgi:hypothetical protein
MHVDTILDESLDRWEKGFRPVWDGVAEQAKMLSTMASGTLVLSISFIQFLTPRSHDIRWGWCVPVSWCLFALTVLVGATRHAWTVRARGYRYLLEPMRGEIRARVAAIATGSDVGAALDRILLDAITKANRDPERAIQVVTNLNAAMYWLFALGLCFLLAFAIRNLPF